MPPTLNHARTSSGTRSVAGARSACRRFVVILAFVLAGTRPALVSAQQHAGAGTAGGAGQSQQAQSASASATPAAPSQSGITGGTGVIEATLFAYQALASEATAVATTILRKVDVPKCSSTCRTIVIAAPSDIQAVFAWRATIEQLRFLEKRSDALVKMKDNGGLCPAPVHAPPRLPAPFIQSPADVQTLAQTLQTLAGLAAISENVSPATQSMTDAPLQALLAGDLAAAGDVAVILPSAFTPGMLTNSGLDGSFIKSELDRLESGRGDLTLAMNDCAAALAKAVADAPRTPAAGAGGNPVPGPGAGSTAVVVLPDTLPIHALIASIGTQITLIDAFEGGLFAAQSSSPVAPGAAQAPNGNTAAPAVAPVTLQPGAPIQQILAGDLLAQRLWHGQSPPKTDDLKALHFLTAHALEAGGELFTKTNLFTGTRVLYGGGAVMTYTLFAGDGAVECSGIAYGYHGDTRPSDVAKDLAKPLTTVLEGNCSN